MKDLFKTRLVRGELLLGTLVTLASPSVAEILADAGFDWLFIDLEHSMLDASDAQVILQAVDKRVDCILRVPLNDEIWIKKALDTGATGVMVPQVNSAEEARRAVRFCKYPPQGSRSVGLARAHGYGANLQGYLEQANANTVVVLQAEHIQAVNNIEAILAVEGVDAILVGPYDLSASMNLIGQVDHPDVQTAIARVQQACMLHGKPLGIFAAGYERAKIYASQGYRLVAAGCDTFLLSQSARQIVNSLKG
jgi:2-dehydro-3-deoxyglucarate aldolase